jgi:sugar lactone lactonase YvrE
MTLWKKSGKPGGSMEKGSGENRPRIAQVAPRAAISGGEIAIHGQGFTPNGSARPAVRFGDVLGNVLISSPNRLVVRVPEDVVSGNLTVDTGSAVSEPASIAVGAVIAENLHPVANPAVDAEGNIFSTFSGSRGEKVAVSVYKIGRDHVSRPFLNDVLNPTGLAIGRDGMLYISSRAEGTIYQVSPEGQRSVYAEGMGVATGIAFDRDDNLYVGDRTGTIFKIDPARQIFVFATLEPSMAAYHLTFAANGDLYVTGPTTSSYDRLYRITSAGEVSPFYRGLGRPQGLAFDTQGNLYVAASVEGRRGVVRLTPQAQPELFVSGHGIVGLAFTPQRSMIVATGSALLELDVGVEGALPLK